MEGRRKAEQGKGESQWGISLSTKKEEKTETVTFQTDRIPPPNKKQKMGELQGGIKGGIVPQEYSSQGFLAMPDFTSNA